MIGPLRGRRSWQGSLGVSIGLGLAIVAGIPVTPPAGGQERSDRGPGAAGRPAGAVSPTVAESVAGAGGAAVAVADTPPPSLGSKARARTGVTRSGIPAAPADLTRIPTSRGPGGWPWGSAGIAMVLVVLGGFAAVSRRFLPRTATGAMQVVGRLSLSPKHSVYLIRVGRRVLLVGAGPQGPPALLSELDELSEIESPPKHPHGGQPEP